MANRTTQRPELVVLLASAGGVQAITSILHELPADFGVPIVIVQHRSAAVPSALPRVLSRSTPLNVKLAEEGETPVAGNVYVAPADRHVSLGADRVMHLADGRRIKFVLSSANPLLDSAASALDGHLVAVVLTGSGSDGTDGVQKVKTRGGIVIAQDPTTADHPAMPQSAINSGAVDYVVQVDEIAPLLQRLVA